MLPVVNPYVRGACDLQQVVLLWSQLDLVLEAAERAMQLRATFTTTFFTERAAQAWEWSVCATWLQKAVPSLATVTRLEAKAPSGQTCWHVHLVVNAHTDGGTQTK